MNKGNTFFIKGFICLYVISTLWQTSCTHFHRGERGDLDKLIYWYDQHKRKSPYLAKTYYKEKAMHDGKYVMFNEGIGYLVFSGLDVDFPLLDHFILFTNFRKSNPKEEWLDYLNNLYSTTDIRNQSDIPPSNGVTFVSFRRFELNGPLDKKNINNFNYSNDSCGSLPGINCLSFESITKNEFSFSGDIYYDEINYDITMVELDLCPYYSEAFRDHLNARLSVKYASYDGISYISSLHLEFEKENLKQWVDIVVLDQKTDVLNLNNDDYITMVGTGNPFIRYTKEEWGKYNIPADKDISIIKEHLEYEDKDLETQFVNNSGLPYYTRDAMNFDSLKYLELLTRFKTEFYSVADH
jgi:hypothetical protein